MINNDSIVTAYDEHLTLVEWLQKIEKLLANGGLKSTALNDKGNATFSLTLTFNDDTTITSPDMTLTSVNEALEAINNDITDIKDGSTHLFETITDKYGNKRFLEGDLRLTQREGITWKYGKWSLSGTHLMLVAMGTFTSDNIPSGALFNIPNLPQFINNKITTSVGELIYYKTQEAYNPQTITFKCGLFKSAIVYCNNVQPINANGYTFRIQFDLLIDDE